jgi:conjugal transfer pilus assembly protein TraB
MSIKIKKQQMMVLGVVTGALAGAIGLLAYFGHEIVETKSVNKSEFKKQKLASPISSESNESHWIEKTQNAWRAQQQKSEKMDEDLKVLSDEKDKQQKELQSQNDQVKELKAVILELQDDLQKLKTQPKVNPPVTKTPGLADPLFSEDSGFIQYSVKLNNIKRPRIKTPENYVFSNTFAKAVALGGADVSAGVLSQANPDVMIFQIIEDGVMPNKYRSPLNGCFFSASAIGDISSERGKFRTERLSCIRPNGKNLDIQITGIVSDSKNGIRGRPVWRDGPMVKKAFWGNFWESMGEVGKQYSTNYSTSPLGSVATLDQAKIPLAAVSSGSAGAAKMYAQYTIKRAEMYHPIIQLPPATVVDVTFLKGFWLDGGTDTETPEQSETAPRCDRYIGNKLDRIHR